MPRPESSLIDAPWRAALPRGRRSALRGMDALSASRCDGAAEAAPSSAVAKRTRMIRVVESPCAADRLRAASEFLAARPAGAEVLIVGAARGAVDDLVRRRCSDRSATFGLHRFTLTQLAARLAAPALSAEGLATCTRLAAEAVATRATFEALGVDAIPFFAPVARCPG